MNLDKVISEVLLKHKYTISLKVLFFLLKFVDFL